MGAFDSNIILPVFGLTEQHKETWRSDPESVWLEGLKKEIEELSQSLEGNHNHSPEHDDSRKGRPRYPLQELNEAIPNLRSISTIHDRVIFMQVVGLIYHPGGRVPRSRTITDDGIRTLRHGLGLLTASH